MNTETDERPPNILFMVWDACRYDYAVEHASFLTELGSSNIWFDNAIAPSPWSLPSHASILSGEYPHTLGKNRFNDVIDTPLVRNLSERGYSCYGVSANGFASQRTGFHKDFDTFRYTGGRDVFLDGMDVSGTAQATFNEAGESYDKALLDVLKRIPRSDARLKSLANLFAVTLGEVATGSQHLQRLPHPLFAPTSDYSYSPEKNTRAIQSILEGHDEDEPFFLFTNYMDTHRCYKPAEELQRKHIGRSLEYSELVRLNEEVAATWPFEEKKVRDELDESDIEEVRGLYAGEVETVDSHLRRIHETLQAENLLEDTIVVVTADHGENLGETDEMGRRRMGHEASISEAVLQVPLVIANPSLTPRTVTELVSLKDLYSLFLNAGAFLDSAGEHLFGLLHDDPIASQYPPKGGAAETINKYPDVPEEIIQYALVDHSAVVYEDDWKVVAESTGARWASNANGEQQFVDAPESLAKLAHEHLSGLEEEDTDTTLSTDDVDQLEALGYL